MGKRLALALTASWLAACATSQRSPIIAHGAKPQERLAAPSSELLEAQEFRRVLEQAYDEIVDRASDSNPPLADPEAGLSIPIPDHPSIAAALEYFRATLRPSIQESLHRSGDYKEMIDAILDQYGLPRALAYLPVIESAYLPRLTSRAGARGIWQFMPETADDYGLSINWWVDERAHPEKSTRAAAQYLRDLYAEFGDWSLVLAAYNCGPGKLRRALRQHHTSSFWDLLNAATLPKETRGYVPTFYATLLIISDPSSSGFVLPNPGPGDSTAVAIEGPVSFEYIATVAGVDKEAIDQLNPQLRRGVVPPGMHSVAVPKGSAAAVEAKAAGLRYEDPLVAVATFTVRPGDSLTRLAADLSIPAEHIRGMNEIRSVRAGDIIYLPLRQQDLSARLQSERYHVVAAGDTLYAIAKANGLTVAELRELNQLKKGHVIHAGERLRVTIRSSVLAGN